MTLHGDSGIPTYSTHTVKWWVYHDDPNARNRLVLVSVSGSVRLTLSEHARSIEWIWVRLTPDQIQLDHGKEIRFQDKCLLVPHWEEIFIPPSIDRQSNWWDWGNLNLG